MIHRRWSDIQCRNCQAASLNEGQREGLTMKSLTISLCLVLLPTGSIAQDIHPDVQAALDWQLPVNDCEPPSIKQSHDTTGLERKLRRAIRKYEKCMYKYMTTLEKDQQKMMDSAAHGLTQDQADTIMRHITVIRKQLQPTIVPPVSALELDDPSVLLAMRQGH